MQLELTESQMALVSGGRDSAFDNAATVTGIVVGGLIGGTAGAIVGYELAQFMEYGNSLSPMSTAQMMGSIYPFPGQDTPSNVAYY